MTTPPRGLDVLRNVDVRLSVELGRTQMKLKDVLALGQDSVVPLDRLTDELLDIHVNGQAIAKGEVVTVGDRFALRIVQLGDEEATPGTPDEAKSPSGSPVPASATAPVPASTPAPAPGSAFDSSGGISG